jgi:hypothetical protein
MSVHPKRSRYTIAILTLALPVAAHVASAAGPVRLPGGRFQPSTRGISGVSCLRKGPIRRPNSPLKHGRSSFLRHLIRWISV